jgi:hypothetical protein
VNGWCAESGMAWSDCLRVWKEWSGVESSTAFPASPLFVSFLLSTTTSHHSVASCCRVLFVTRRQSASKHAEQLVHLISYIDLSGFCFSSPPSLPTLLHMSSSTSIHFLPPFLSPYRCAASTYLYAFLCCPLTHSFLLRAFR